MPTSAELTPQQRVLVAAYRARDLSVKELLVTHAATRSKLDAALRKAREPFRRPASAKSGRNLRRQAPLDATVSGDAGDGRGLERRLARLLSERIAELEDRCSRGRSAEPEAVAKALALNVRTLATLRRTAATQDKGGNTDHGIIDAASDGEPPRSLAALRDELYGHLQRIRDEERARRGLPATSAHDDGGGADAAPLADLLPGEPAPSGR